MFLGTPVEIMTKPVGRSRNLANTEPAVPHSGDCGLGLDGASRPWAFTILWTAASTSPWRVA
jgi:hypothetical protein